MRLHAHGYNTKHIKLQSTKLFNYLWDASEKKIREY